MVAITALGRRQPQREVAGVMLDENAGEALQQPNMARWSITGVTLLECSSI